VEGPTIAKIRVLVLLLRRFLGLAEGGMLPESRRILPRRGKHVAPMFFDNRRSVWIEDPSGLNMKTTAICRVLRVCPDMAAGAEDSLFPISSKTLSAAEGIPRSPFRIPHFQVVAERRGIPHSPFRIPHFHGPFHLPPLTIPLSYFPRQGMEDRGDSTMNWPSETIGRPMAPVRNVDKDCLGI